MILEQHRGANMAFSAGYYFLGNVKGGDFRLEYNLSSMFGAASASGNVIPGFKIYIEAGFDYGTYYSPNFRFFDVNYVYAETVANGPAEVYKANFAFARVGLGLAKSFQLVSNVALVPELAWNWEFALSNKMWNENGVEVDLHKVVDPLTLREPEDISNLGTLSYNNHYIVAGAMLVINVVYPFHVFGGVDIYLPVWGPVDRSFQPFYDYKWNDFFADRRGISFTGGIRLEF